MASVRKFQGSAHWYACYRGPDGRRVQRSTKLTDRGDALAEAIAYEQAARAAQSKAWSELHARKFLAQIRALHGEDVSGESVSGLLQRWIGATRGGMRPASARKYRDTVGRFVEHLGPLSAAPAGTITPAMIAQWRDTMLTSGLAPKTVSGALAIIRQGFQQAVAAGVLLDNPLARVRVTVRPDPSPRRPFTLGQFRALLAATSGEWRLFLVLLGCTGSRQQEIAQLRWDQVDLAAGVIRLRRGKQRGAAHVVPAHPFAVRELRSAFAATSSVHVLPTLAGWRGQRLSKHFREHVLPSIGIKQPYGRSGERCVAAYSLHSFRHALSSWLDASGATEAERRAILGHSDVEVNRGYTHADLDRAAAALARVDFA